MPPVDPIALYGSALRGYRRPTAANVTANSSNRLAQVRDATALARHSNANGDKPTWRDSDPHFANQPCVQHVNGQPLDTASWAAEAQPRTVVFVGCCDDRLSVSAWVDGIAASTTPMARFGALNWYMGVGGTLDGGWGGGNGGHASATDGLVAPSRIVHAMKAYFNGGSSTFDVDGVLRATGNGGAAASTGTRIGAKFDGTLPATGRWGIQYEVNRNLTASEWARDLRALTEFIPGQLFFYGDSIIAGNHNAAGMSISKQLEAGGLLAEPFQIFNFGIPSAYAGGSSLDLSVIVTTCIDPLIHALAEVKIAYYAAGVNDAFGSLPPAPRSPAAIKANIDTFAIDRLALGVQTIVGTILPTPGTGQQESIRVATNALITANATNAPYMVDDRAADPRFLDPFDTTVYQNDRLHLTDLGNRYLAERIAPRINIISRRTRRSFPQWHRKRMFLAGTNPSAARLLHPPVLSTNLEFSR